MTQKHTEEPGHFDVGPELFTISVAEFADDGLADPSRPAPSREEVVEMALSALRAAWSDLWRETDRPFRGHDVIVTARLADGTFVRRVSK